MNEERILPVEQRPLSPRLSVYRWRAPMMASLAHRISGLMLVVFMLGYPCLLALMLGGEEGFAAVRGWLHGVWGRVYLWAGGAALVYHWVNGLRFLLLDAGFGESREAMRLGAKLALMIGVAAALALAAALWELGDS